MKFVSCLHPKFIVNQYTGISQFVPCGKCSACLNAKSLQWQQRLENEVRKYKYLFFCTLTYDDYHMHVLTQCETFKGKFYTSNDTDVVISYDDVCDDSFEYRGHRVLNVDYLSSRPFIPHLYKKDVSAFIKRLRSMIHYNFKINNIKENEKVHFFACGEYGETTYRPHYHVLFWFDSKFLSETIFSYVSRCWQFGSVDVKASDPNVSQYLTKYCNSFGSLPQIYLSEQIRPFNLCSKRSPVGFTSFDQVTLQNIFRNGLVEIPVWSASKRKTVYVRLWRSLENKLFPRLKGFNQIPHYERVRLLSINTIDGFSSPEFSSFFRKVQTFVCSNGKNFPFREVSKDKRGEIAFYTFIVKLLSDYGFLETDINGEYSSLRNLYYLSRTCSKRAFLLGLSMDDFVSKIEIYYENVEIYNLKSQLLYEDDMIRKGYLTTRDLIYLDLRLVKRIKETDNRFGLSKSMIITLGSLGFANPDYSFCTMVDVVRDYLEKHPITSFSEYSNYKSLHDRIYRSSVKNKVKKDTLDYYKNNNLYSFTNL